MNPAHRIGTGLAAMLLAAGLAHAQQSCPAGDPHTTPDADFADAGNGTVRHLPTGLVWKRCTEGQTWNGSTCTGAAATYAWQQAFQRADAVNAGTPGTQNAGFTDWRVPNLKELRSIVERGCNNPSINLTQFPATPALFFWSGSPHASYPGGAWGVLFGNGNGDWFTRSLTSRVRLVRAGQYFYNFDALAPQADLSIVKTDGVTSVVPGGTVTYTITSSNAGPAGAPGTTVADTLPAALTGASWTCVGAGGGSCTASGSGNLNDTVNLPAGASVTYTVQATVSGSASGTLSNTATVTAGAGITDPNPGNNSATDSDTILAPQAITGFAPASPVVFGAAPATLSATGGGSGNPVVFATTSAASICTVSGTTVTFTGAGTCTLTANQAGNANYSAAAQVTATVIVQASPPPDPNTACRDQTLFSHVHFGPCALDVNRIDNGPALLGDVATLVGQALGLSNVRYQAQTCGGAVVLEHEGGRLAFLLLYVQPGDSRGDGIYVASAGQWSNGHYSNGTYTIVTRGTALTVAPAVARLCELEPLLADWHLRVNAQGTLSASYQGTTYVVIPGYRVQTMPAGVPRLWLGEDGYWRFSDSQGDTQVLYPAFAEPGVLWGELLALDEQAGLDIQLDATARIWLQGQQYVLTPDLNLGPTPAEHASEPWWQESERRYRLRIRSEPIPGASQGFGVR